MSPQKPGARGKTPRRDALTLARLLRAGDRPPVSVPTGDDAAMRARCRGRAAARRALTTAPVRRNAVLLRHASRSTGRAPWGPAPRRGRRVVVWPTPAPPLVCHADRRAVTAHPERLARLAHALTAQGQPGRLAPVVAALQARRGGPGPGAVPPVAARGALPRFNPPRPLLPSLGCTPADDSPAARRRPGGSPKTGNRQARRALGAGAWASRCPAQVRRPLQRRLQQGSQPRPDLRWQAQRRRGNRDRPLRARGQNAHQVAVASARARRAFLWAMAQAGALTPEREPSDRPAAMFPRCCSSIGRGAAPV